MNGIALGLAGYALEPLIGRAWFAALFVIGALCGSLASMFLNTGNIVSVGASGAVMALFAAMLMIARRFPPGETRMRLTMNAISRGRRLRGDASATELPRLPVPGRPDPAEPDAHQ